VEKNIIQNMHLYKKKKIDYVWMVIMFNDLMILQVDEDGYVQEKMLNLYHVMLLKR